MKKSPVRFLLRHVICSRWTSSKATASTRRPLAGLESDWAPETFAISPDGNRICLAEWEQVSSIMTAEGVPGVDLAKCAR